MKRIILFFALNIFQIFARERIICNTSYSRNLKENEIVFFESPNFPKTIDTETKEKCAMEFTGTSDDEDMHLIFAVTNGHPDGGQIYDNGYDKLLEFPIIDYYITPNETLKFSFANNATKSEWEGFQGYVTYEKLKNDSCPLANRNEPFIFKNESEVLYLRSSYFWNLTDDIKQWQEKECVWNFLAPDGYSFKILSLYADSKILVVTKNDTRQLIQSHLPFYFYTNNITISYTAAYENRIFTDKAFLARISIVNLFKTESADYCTFNETEQTWSIPLNKYTTKVKCQKSFTIESKHQLYAHVTNLETTGVSNILSFIDVLRYYVDDKLLYPVPFASTGLYAFLPFENGTISNLTFEYTSDESLTFEGFSVTFRDVVCKCINTKFVIPCFGEKNYSMIANNDFYYCAELSCNFEIILDETCPNNTISLKTFTNFDENYSANLQVISDGHVLINTSGVYKRIYEGRQQSALIFPNRNTVISNIRKNKMKTAVSEKKGQTAVFPFITIESLEIAAGNFDLPIGSVRIWATSFNEPTHLPKKLITNEVPFYIFSSNELAANQVLTIQLSKELSTKNEILEIFYETSNVKHLLHCLTLYNDETMETIFTMDLIYSNIVINTSLTIYKYAHCDNDLTKLIIRAKTYQSKTCRFQNNMVNIGEIMKKSNKVTMISDPEHSCKFILINNMEFYVIKEMLTSSADQNVVIYNGHDREHKMLELNRNMSSKWKHMTINALSYLIIIPPKSSFLIEFYEPLYSIKFTEPLFSYYETPYYGTPSFKPISSNTTYQISENLEVTFTVSDLDISSSGILQLIFSNGTISNFYSKNDMKNVQLKQNETVNVYYKETKNGYKGAKINIIVQLKPRHFSSHINK